VKVKTGGETFKVYITVDITGKYPKVVPDVTDEELKKNGNLQRWWAEFIRWDWISLNQILKEARVENVVTGRRDIDFQSMRELKLRKLLKDWSLEEDGKKIKVKRDENGLTEESWKEVISVDFAVLTAFLNKADLVLELGQEEESDFIKVSPQLSVPAETK